MTTKKIAPTTKTVASSSPKKPEVVPVDLDEADTTEAVRDEIQALLTEFREVKAFTNLGERERNNKLIELAKVRAANPVPNPPRPTQTVPRHQGIVKTGGLDLGHDSHTFAFKHGDPEDMDDLLAHLRKETGQEEIHVTHVNGVLHVHPDHLVEKNTVKKALDSFDPKKSYQLSNAKDIENIANKLDRGVELNDGEHKILLQELIKLVPRKK